MSQNKEQGLMNHNPLVMNSLGVECQQLKHSYDSCFNAWFSEEFLSGSKDMSQCEPLLKLYKECVQVGHFYIGDAMTIHANVKGSANTNALRMKVMAEKKIDVGAIENGVRKKTTYQKMCEK